MRISALLFRQKSLTMGKSFDIIAVGLVWKARLDDGVDDRKSDDDNNLEHFSEPMGFSNNCWDFSIVY